jgi:hypothetical protein
MASFSFVLVFFLMAIVCATVVLLALIIAKAAKDSRERTLWHEERMAMIEAGIHPDYPPDEAPAEDQDDTPRQTADFSQS